MCEWLLPGGIEHIDALVIDYVPRRISIGGVFSLGGGLVIRDDIIDVIGRERLSELCHLRPVVLKSGAALDGFHLLVEKQTRGCLRGYPEESRIRLCKECGRPLYWPMPVDRWYLLRAYWGDSKDVCIMKGDLLCTPQYHKEVLAPLKIPGLVGPTYPVVDVPADGLPIPYDELVAEVGRRGWVCD